MARIVAIDDDACLLYADAGRNIELASQHDAFTLAEQARWQEALDAGRVVVAVTTGDEPIGFASLGFVDSEPHLQQVSVRRAWMRRGVGRALMDYAIAWGGEALWLTTYADSPGIVRSTSGWAFRVSTKRAVVRRCAASSTTRDVRCPHLISEWRWRDVPNVVADDGRHSLA
jgi:GNAT superfamily N-acetyltransferase